MPGAGGVATIGLGPAKGVDCGKGVAGGDAAGVVVCFGDADGVDGADLRVAGGAVGCCARAEYPAPKEIASPKTTFSKRLGDWCWPTRITQPTRFVTSCSLGSEFY